MKKIIIGLIVVVGIIILATLALGIYKFNFTNDDIHIVCTMEAKLCLDGSSVGRTGPNCEFAQCPKVVDTAKTATFICDGESSITTTFYLPSDTAVDLKLSDGRSLSLLHAISASGARYANQDEDIVFWNKGDTAFITEGDKTTYNNCMTGAAVVAIWKTQTDAKSGISFQYPDKLSTKYIDTVDWPPVVQVVDKPFACTPGGSEVLPAGQTAQQTINGHTYCVTKEAEGAAGSTYTTYIYAFAKNNQTASLKFTLRSVQCMNYDDPKQIECLTERVAFDVDGLADAMAGSVR